MVVANDVSSIKNNGSIIGLHLNTDKCELISTTVSNVSPIDSFVHIDIDKATLLGAPLTPGVSMDYALNKKLNELNRAADRLRLITSHDVLVLPKASCTCSVSAISSLVFLASTSSTWQLQNQLLIDCQLPANDLHFDHLKEEWINKHHSI